jgi:hypothetical protein
MDSFQAREVPSCASKDTLWIAGERSGNSAVEP